MNYALIFAGGTGQRMHTNGIPKQFLEVDGKPIIIHTIERFNNSPRIDGIVVVCIKSYINKLRDLVRFHHIGKIINIVEGGCTGQESIYNGLLELEKNVDLNSIVLIHDGVRPFIESELINDNIDVATKFGNAISISPAIETICILDDTGKNGQIKKVIDRNKCWVAKAPQTFILRNILHGHQWARNNKLEFIDSAQLMLSYGEKLNVVHTNTKNIKITTPVDFYMMRAILEAEESKNVIGI